MPALVKHEPTVKRRRASLTEQDLDGGPSSWREVANQGWRPGHFSDHPDCRPRPAVRAGRRATDSTR